MHEFVRRVDGAAQRIATVVLEALANSERRVANAVGQLRTFRTTVLDAAKSRINVLAAEIASFDPVVLMRRGWSITYDRNGKVLRSVKQTKKGDGVTIRLADGQATSTITEVSTNKEH